MQKYRSGFRKTASDLWPLWIIGVIVLALLTVAIDGMFLSGQCGAGTIEGKKFTPAYVSYFKHHAVAHPDEYEVLIRVGSKYDWLSVPGVRYEKLCRGDQVNVIYGRGRIFGGIYASDVEGAEKERR